VHAGALDEIRSAAEHLLGLIDTGLDLSAGEYRQAELHLERFPVEPVLRGLVDAVRPGIQRNGNILHLRVTEGLGEMHSDPIKLRQILFNLLSNATRFTKRGSVVLGAEREVAPGGADWIRIQVEQSGINIAEAHIRELFRPLEQADASITRKHASSDLGLSITRGYCELMGGTVSVGSGPHGGTIFTVHLPAHIQVSDPLAPLSVSTSGREQRNRSLENPTAEPLPI
jgi:signal transduction histidine kinase